VKNTETSFVFIARLSLSLPYQTAVYK